MARGGVYIATETHAVQWADEQGTVQDTLVRAGQTRVREGHPILKANPQYFRHVDEGVHFDVETAGGPEPETRRDVQILETREPAKPEPTAEDQQAAEDKQATDAAIVAAIEAGIDISTIQGTGVGGRVLVSDIKAAIAAKKPNA